MMRTAAIPSRTEMLSKTSECETTVRTSRNFVSKGDIIPVHDESFCNSCQLSLGHCARPSDEFLQSTIGNQNFTNKSSYVLKNKRHQIVCKMAIIAQEKSSGFHIVKEKKMARGDNCCGADCRKICSVWKLHVTPQIDQWVANCSSIHIRKHTIYSGTSG
jgi:hypothetical protein